MKLILDIALLLFLSLRCTYESLNNPANWKTSETDSQNNKAKYVDQNISYFSRVVRRYERNKINGPLDERIYLLVNSFMKAVNHSIQVFPLALTQSYYCFSWFSILT